MRFVLAGVASEVGHGMVGLFRQARCEKVRLVPVRCGIVRSGRHGRFTCGLVRSGELSFGEAGQAWCGVTRYGGVGLGRCGVFRLDGVWRGELRQVIYRRLYG